MTTCILTEVKNASKVDHSSVFQNLITREDAKVLVKKSVSPDAELIDFDLQPFSDEKLGYLGTHLSLVVTARTPGQVRNEKRKLFLKTLPYEVPAQATFVQEKGCIRKETNFYKLVEPLMTENFKGERWVPRCYSVKNDVMIFEDLKPEGYSNKPRSLDVKSVEIAFACIARMHASSLLAEERLGGKSLKELYPDVFDESEFNREGRNYTNYMVGVKFAIDLANDMGLDSSKIQRASERVFELYESSKTKRNVVCHGDLWSSNLIFDQHNHCRLVDFQMVRYLPPGHDLMLLLYYGASTEVRKNHEQKLVKNYYETLIETLKSNDFKSKIPSFDELLQGIEELRLPALLTAVLFHPIVLLDSQTATKIMCDPITCEAIFFGDRKSIVKEYMAKNPEYKKKIQDNVKEFVEMSLHLDSAQ